MFEFHTEGAGELAIGLAFDGFGYANISFFDAPRAEIPLHLSLRQAEGVAVFNRRIAGQWQAERKVPLPPGDRLEVQFDGDRVRATLGQALLFDLGPDDCPDLASIAWHEVTGGFMPETMQVSGAGNAARRGQGGLVHVAPFAVQGWALDAALAVQDLRLDLGDLPEPPRPLILPRPDLGLPGGAVAQSLHLTLPGRVWQAVPPGGALGLRLQVNGVTCGPDLALDREAMARALDLILQNPGVEAAADQAVLALDHVHHGGFWPRLSEASRQALRRIARIWGLTGLLPADQALPVVAPAPAALDDDLTEQAWRAVLRRLSDDPGGSVAAALQGLPHLPPHLRWPLYLRLTELACEADQFDDLHALALSQGAVDLTLPGDDWSRAALLPWLWRAGAGPVVVQALWQLGKVATGGLADQALAWLLGRLGRQDDPRLGPDLRAEAVYAILALLERRAADYWAHRPTRRLIDGMVDLIGGARSLPDAVQARIETGALHILGTSPRFWAALQAAGLGQGGLLAMGRAAFALVQGAGTPNPAGVREGLETLQALGLPEAARMRWELLGPPDADGAASGLLPYAARAGAPAGAALIRALAWPAPSGAPVADPADLRAVAPLVAEAIAAATPTVPRHPWHGMQLDLSRQMTAALQTGAGLEPLLAPMQALAGPEARFLGLGLGLSLVAALLRQGQEAEAQDIAAGLSGMAARVTEADRPAMVQAAAVRSGLGALAGTGAPLAQSLAALMDLPLPDLPQNPVLRVPPLMPVLVVVLSCQPYLATRIPALRDGWLRDLQALGVPHVIAVGGGTGPARLEGDVLILPVSDAYEDLPAKTLAAVAWVHGQTDAGHMLKIDDDCFLNADLYLHAQSWRKHDYHGRVLTRTRGQMDRAWHQAKSRSHRGRFELDRSPEPSTYCDGGSGYALSRAAMSALLQGAAGRAGAELIAASFMEDKMVGDLLALAGMAPSGEDHAVSLWRRLPGAARPVPIWANGFLPGPLNPVKLAHLDDTAAQAVAAEALHSPGLTPAKIWPTYATPRLGYNSNLLELLSPAEKLHRLNRADLAVVATMRNESFMLPHFLAHYRGLGVGCFLIADNLSDDGTLDLLLEQPDVVTFSVDSDYNVSAYGVAWQQAILGNFRVGRWSLVADADELLVAEGGMDALLAGIEPDADAMRLYMLDMYPGGPLSEARFTAGPFAEAGYCDSDPFRAEPRLRGVFGDQPTVTSALRHRLMPGSRPELFVAQKLALMRYRPWMRLTAGLHYLGEAQVSAREGLLAHFKYNAQFAEKARSEVARRQHFNDAEEYRRYLAILAEGREVLFDPAVSVPWRQAAAVRRILG